MSTDGANPPGPGPGPAERNFDGPVTDPSGLKLTRRGKVALVLGILAGLAAALAAGGYVYLSSIGVLGTSSPGPPVDVTIPEGASVRDIGRLLEAQGVIRSVFGFRIAAYIEGGAENIQAGDYALSTGLTARDALAALLEGPTIEFVTVTIPEGSWLTDFARIVNRDTHISRAEFMSVATSGAIRSQFQPNDVDLLEGLLFPSTYQVIESDTAETLLTRLVNEFDERVAALDLGGSKALGLTKYEVIIVASMIEAEAQVEAERGMIAAVMYNRLQSGTPLGIDATINYAIKEHRLELTRSELAIDSPYNTRIHVGLPPTPIGAPGQASLEAAADPDEGDWFFYVLRDCSGNHAFSTSSAQFARDKAAYQALDCSS